MIEELKYTEILKRNRVLKEKCQESSIIPIKVLSNLTLNQLGEILSYHLFSNKIFPKVTFGGYDNIVQDSYGCTESKVVIVHYELLNILEKNNKFIEDFTDREIDEIYENIVAEISLIISNLKGVPLILFNSFSAHTSFSSALKKTKLSVLKERLNNFLFHYQEKNLQIVDLDIILTKIGCNNAFDYKMYYLSKTLYTPLFWQYYAESVLPVFLKITGKLKKVIIFDCDNTLWKGILGEDGENGIDMSPESKIGSIFHTVQKIAVWLSHHGILIGLCSKNNYDDVWKVIQNHPSMLLSENEIVISKINWNDKASNLREIAAELNVGLDSLVFIDDSQFEVNLIKEHLPEVTVMSVPEELSFYPRKLLNYIERYFSISDNKEDLSKTLQYKAQAMRNMEKVKYSSLDEYLKSLNINVRVCYNEKLAISRVSQLTQKTNQFNLTTKRYTEAEIDTLMNDGTTLVTSYYVNDKFGDSGLTAVVIVKLEENKAYIDSFLQSCRIMGRNIEFAIMDHLIDYLKQKGVKEVHACYFPTAKNLPVEEYYEKAGFLLETCDNTEKKYLLRLDEYIPKEITYIKILN